MASEDAEPQRVLSADSVESWDMKKHASSAFKQQRLPAWSPILSPSSVLPIFLVVGALLIPAGVGLLFLSESVREYRVVYTYCRQYFQENGTFGQRSCAEVLAETYETCHCAYNFSLPQHVKKPVFLYYQLTNFHQNHRRYVNSRDDFQLLGQLEQRVASVCAPFDYDGEGRPIERGPHRVDAHRRPAQLPQAVPPRGPQQGAIHGGPAKGKLHALHRLQLPGGAVPRRQDVRGDGDDGHRRGQPVPGGGLRERGLGLPGAGRALRGHPPALPPAHRAHGQRRAAHALPLTSPSPLDRAFTHLFQQ